ncbi:MAG: dinitrogenase iron-molybdenum cofactor [Clostridiaceae bacterium]|nr:dinitrogenase iron-molybdenum cofactor [Clostridiaceae bacterium]
MKIAVASEGQTITQHFGHCQNFNIYEVQEGTIVQRESVLNPVHKPGFLPKFHHDLVFNVIISGGIGGGAVDICCEKGIEVVAGAQGDSRAAAEAYLAGTLDASGAICRDHDHQD